MGAGLAGLDIFAAKCSENRSGYSIATGLFKKAIWYQSILYVTGFASVMYQGAH